MADSNLNKALESSVYLTEESAAELTELCQRWGETGQAAITRAVAQCWGFPELEVLEPQASLPKRQ
jgi:hypothetical protein